MSKLNEIKIKVFSTANSYIAKMNSRERLLAILAIVVAIAIGINTIYSPIAEAFKQQSDSLQKSEMYLEELPNILQRFLQLEAKRKAIEKAYQGIEIGEGFSHIEEIIKAKADLSNQSDYQIRPMPLANKKFGGDYEKKSFRVEIKFRSLQALASVLKEVTQGSKPMILSQIELTRSPAGDFINAVLELSTIQKVNSEE